MVPGGFFLIAFGVFFLVASNNDWDWLFNVSWPLNILFKRERVTQYYAILGLMLALLGIFLVILNFIS